MCKPIIYYVIIKFTVSQCFLYIFYIYFVYMRIIYSLPFCEKTYKNRKKSVDALPTLFFKIGTEKQGMLSHF